MGLSTINVLRMDRNMTPNNQISLSKIHYDVTMTSWGRNDVLLRHQDSGLWQNGGKIGILVFVQSSQHEQTKSSIANESN